jgi:hypothetical protein
MPLFLVEPLNSVVDRELHPLRFLRTFGARGVRQRGLHGAFALALFFARFLIFALLVIERSFDMRLRFAWHD